MQFDVRRPSPCGGEEPQLATVGTPREAVVRSRRDGTAAAARGATHLLSVRTPLQLESFYTEQTSSSFQARNVTPEELDRILSYSTVARTNRRGDEKIVRLTQPNA